MYQPSVDMLCNAAYLEVVGSLLCWVFTASFSCYVKGSQPITFLLYPNWKVQSKTQSCLGKRKTKQKMERIRERK